MYPDIPDSQEEGGVRHQPEGEAQALKQEKVQPGGANIVEGPGEIHNYATKYATALGIVHIVCGVVNMLVVYLVSLLAGTPHVASGILPSVLFFASGSVAIQGACQRSRCLVSVGQTLSILSAIVAALLLAASSVAMAVLTGGRSDLVITILTSLVMVTMLIVATISAILPCLIEAPQGNATKVQDDTTPASGSALRKNNAILGMSVVHLICGLLFVLTDMVSTRHVGNGFDSIDGSILVNGFTFPPGALTSVGIFLVASSVLSLANLKRRSKLLFVSAVVPTVYAAVSAGIVLFVSFVSIPEHRYGYDYDNTSVGLPIGLAIFGALAITSTTTASAILSSQFLGTNSNDKILV